MAPVSKTVSPGPASATRKTSEAPSAQTHATHRSDVTKPVKETAGATDEPSDAYEVKTPQQSLIKTGSPPDDAGNNAPVLSTLGLLQKNKRNPASVDDEVQAKSATTKQREPHELVLANPYTDASANASHSALVTSSMAYGLEQLADKYPDIDQNFAARFLEMAAVGGALVPKSVYEHEMGHARAVNKVGGNAEITMTGWMSGYTRYKNLPADPSGKNAIAIAAAGVNQGQITAGHMYKDWARNGSVRYQEAMGYLLAQTNLGLYAARTQMRGDNAPSGDDIAAYVSRMNNNGHKLSTGQILAMSAAADLASAPVWAAMKGQLDFVRKGERSVELPTFKIGDVSATFPNFQTFLTSDGPVIGGQLLVNPDKKLPVELTFHTRFDGSAMAAGAKLYDLPLAKNVTLNPYIRGTFDKENGTGYMIGSDVRYSINDSIDLVGQVEFSQKDLLAEPFGKDDGITASVGVAFRF